jgi:hypothetical protein
MDPNLCQSERGRSWASLYTVCTRYMGRRCRRIQTRKVRGPKARLELLTVSFASTTWHSRLYADSCCVDSREVPGSVSDVSCMKLNGCHGMMLIVIIEQYALTEAGLLIVRLLQHFDAIEWTGPAGRPKKGLGITLFPKDGTQVRMRYARKS